MSHLSDSEFTDLLDGQLPPSRAAHVSACAACREQFDSIRLARTLAFENDVPEPSPLFWEHFSGRVRDAIDAGQSRSHSRWSAWRRSPSMAWAGGAVLAILLLATALVRLPIRVGDPGEATLAGDWSQSERAAAHLRDEMENDAEWAIVRSAADDLDWSDAQAAGMAPRPGSAEMVALELSDEERAELARLLEDELKRNGA